MLIVPWIIPLKYGNLLFGVCWITQVLRGFRMIYSLPLYNGYLLRKISNVFWICQLLVNVSFFYTKAETISTTKEIFFPFLFQKPMIWNEKTRVIISPTFSPWLELGLRSIVSFYQLLFIAKKCQKRIHFFQKE